MGCLQFLAHFYIINTACLVKLSNFDVNPLIYHPNLKKKENKWQVLECVLKSRQIRLTVVSKHDFNKYWFLDRYLGKTIIMGAGKI